MCAFRICATVVAAPAAGAKTSPTATAISSRRTIRERIDEQLSRRTWIDVRFRHAGLFFLRVGNPDIARFCLACGSALAAEQAPSREDRPVVSIIFVWHGCGVVYGGEWHTATLQCVYRIA